MKINDLEFYLVEIGRTDPEEPVRSLLVRLRTETGLHGWGEARVPWRPGELLARRKALLPVLAGRSIFDIEELLTLEALSSAPLRLAVEMASWDLVGRATHQPLFHLLGGGYRRQIPMAVRLGGRRPERVAMLARAMAEQGFHALVLTSCGRLDGDLATLAAVRESAGQGTELRLDGAAQYDAETARDLCAELEYDSLQLFLDPVRGADVFSVATLARQTSIPLGIWRAIRSPTDVLITIRCGAVPYVVVDLERVGGLTPARNCAAVAHAGGIRALLGGGPSLGTAAAAMLHLAAAIPAFSSGNECAYHQLQDDVLAEPLNIVDGMMPVPQGPGLGVRVDLAKVERYHVAQ